MPKKVFADDPDWVIHGVNCKCQDSCLEYWCYKCDYGWSSNILETKCDNCGAPIKPDIYDDDEEVRYG